MRLSRFGKVVRKARIDADALLGDMADHMGVTPSYLSSIETGRRKLTQEVVDKAHAYFKSIGRLPCICDLAQFIDDDVPTEGNVDG